MDLNVIRRGKKLIPLRDEDLEELQKLPLEKAMRATIRVPRNYLFLQKFFAMLNVGFESWEPPEQEYRGLPVEKNKERFREDCLIAAGHYDLVADLSGNVVPKARSISFASMDETRFEAVYSAVANVLLQRVLGNYTREDLDEQVVERILGFT